MFINKNVTEKVERAVQKQSVLDKKIHEETMSKVWRSHNKEIEKIHRSYRKEVEKIIKKHNGELKKIGSERITKYEEDIKSKNDEIEKLKEEVSALVKKVRNYEAAYDMYKDLRGHLFQMTRKMKQATDKIKINSSEIYQSFSELDDLSDFHTRKMESIEPKIMNKMLAADDDHRVELSVVK
ncbi:hypothetical protein ACFL20_04820 [Spirochaetota bacterium]